MARLDSELVMRGLARSRERAKEMIKSGSVTVNSVVVKKASADVGIEDIIESSVREVYVGRGALKLKKAYEVFGLDFSGKKCLDIGASTGGFTDFMLEKGAEKVWAVDVGYNQLAEKLKNDSRVFSLEKTDIRTVTPETLGGMADFVSADVSFISLKMILPKIYELLSENGESVVLIKPQFEAGKKYIGKHGIVRDRKVHERVLSEVNAFIHSVGLTAVGYTFSPIKGGSGNIEYLAYIRRIGVVPSVYDFGSIVENSFNKLKEMSDESSIIP